MSLTHKLASVLIGLTLLIAVPTVAVAASYTFVDDGARDYDTNSSNALTPGAPTGLQNGHLELLFTGARATGLTVTAMTDWTELSFDNATPISFGVYCHIADGTHDTPSVQWSGTTQDAFAVILAYSGDVHSCAGITDALDDVNNTDNNASVLVLPVLNVVANDTLVIGFSMRYKTADSDDATTITAGGGLTKRHQHIQAGAGAMMFVIADQQQTTSTDYDGTDFTRDGSDEDPANTSSGMVISLLTEEAEATPAAFDSNPACASLDFETMRCVVDAGADTLTIEYCVLAKDDTTPASDAAVETCAGGLVSGSEAATGASQNIDIDLGADPFPIADYYFVGKNVTLYNTFQSQLDETVPAPSGKQYVVRSGNPGAGELDLFEGASPAVADGDYMAAVTFCDSFLLGAAAHALTLEVTGTPIIAADGDLSRQNCPRRFYDINVQDWSDATYIAAYINNIPPVYVGLDDEEGTIDPYLFEVDIDFDIDVLQLFTDDESDPLILAVTNNPSGGSVTGGDTWSGPFDTCGEFTNPSLEATDIAGDSDAQTETVNVGGRVPDVIGDDEATAVAAIEAVCAFTATAGNPVHSQSVAVDMVAQTDPDVDELLVHDSEVIYFLSMGINEGGGNVKVMRARNGMRIIN